MTRIHCQNGISVALSSDEAAPFSPYRWMHQNPNAGEVTGEAPVAAMLSETNRYQCELGYSDGKQGWDGCIDAPCVLPAGSMLNLSPRMIGEHEWEGACVSRNISRDA